MPTLINYPVPTSYIVCIILFISVLAGQFFSGNTTTMPKLTNLPIDLIKEWKPPSRQYAALVLGATGAVGTELVKELLASPHCAKVTTFVRKQSEVLAKQPNADTKLTQHEVDMNNLEADVSKDGKLEGHDVAFVTLGAGQPSKMSVAEHWRIDVELPMAFARACRKVESVKYIALLSGVGVPDEKRRYEEGPPTVKSPGMESFGQVKSGIQDGLRKLNFHRLSIYQPSVLITPESRYGLTDIFNQKIFPVLALALPKKYEEVKIAYLARAMRLDAERGLEANVQGNYVLHKQEFDVLNALEPQAKK